MSQEVLYRKWRPQLFADVAGQQPITTTLRNAVAGATPAHAYLFTGPRGTGKTTTGRILAKAVNCTAPEAGEPCEHCQSCESFNQGRALDLIELDAASNRGIDEVRALREAAGYAPNSARYKVYLIDEVHMLTDAAFNALLKTLEEPPPHVIFILATTEVHRIPATILSRCQRFDFRRITLNASVYRLRTIADGEGIEVAPGSLEAIARHATGSLRDGVNLLDQLVAYHGNALDLEGVQRGLGLVIDERTTELARAAITHDLASGLTLIAGARDDGVEIRAFIREVVNTLRAVLMLKAGAGDQLSVSDAQGAELAALAASAQGPDIVSALRALGSLDYAGDPYDSLPAEVAFASLAVGLLEPTMAAAPPRAVAPSPAPAAAAPSAQRPERRTAPAATSAPRTPRPAPQPPQARREPAPEGATQQVETRDAPRGPGASPMELPDAENASPELLALRAQWGKIREGARQRSNVAGALLNTVWHIKSFDDDVVELGFRFPAMVTKLQEDVKALQAIVETCSEAAGRQVRVTAVVWDVLATASPAPQAAAAAAGGGRPSGGASHLLEEALRAGAVRIEE
ncbi:MAG: DNA polymerase III subunit gamma/tau [Chloroflexota bacterium]